MKVQVTKKQVMSSYSNILKLSSCKLQDLLNRFSPRYYTCGVNGWNADIYIIDGMCIVTGYNPFGNIMPSVDIVKHAESMFNECIHNNIGTDAENKEAIEILKCLLK